MIHVEWMDLPKCFTGHNAVFSTKAIIEVVKAPRTDEIVDHSSVEEKDAIAIHKQHKLKPSVKKKGRWLSASVDCDLSFQLMMKRCCNPQENTPDSISG